jgi:phosphodiesterase/alkaline phosphatase D-like protein
VGVGTSVILTGLQPGTAYYFRVAATNATGETKGTETEPIREFKTLALHVPVIESEASANITQTTATLEAQVNPEYQATPYTFEYATEESVLLEGHGTTVAGGELPAGSIQAGFGEHAAHAEAAGLAPDTLYFYRVAAHNPAGPAEPLSPVQTFTTTSVPLASTGEAQAITATAASLTATVNPSGLPTTYYFEYGHTTGYDRQAPFPQATVPAGSAALPVTVAVSGLEPGSTYHYRIVATNTSNGTVQTVQGEDETFTTVATPPIITGLTAGAVTQTSAVISASLNPQGLPTRWELQMRAPGGSVQLITSGETSATTPLELNVGSLAPGTEYRYTLRASNSSGTIAPEGFFTTAPGPAAGASTGLPALIPFTPISTITAREEAENQKNAGSGKPLTNKQKLAKALRACRSKHGHRRALCEATARRHYGPTKKGKS